MASKLIDCNHFASFNIFNIQRLGEHERRNLCGRKFKAEPVQNASLRNMLLQASEIFVISINNLRVVISFF